MTFDRGYFNLGYIDTLSYKDTFIHRLDPRIKLASTFIFILTIVSFPKYEVSGLVPFFLFPALLLLFGDIPVSFILKKVLIVSPFALFVGIFNPFLDTKALYDFNGILISGGWISFLSVIIKFVLTVSAGLLLIATTSFPGVCYALQQLGIPDIFVSQLLFLYRYIFVLMEETMRVVRARDLRSFGRKGHGMETFVNITGTLFIKTVERSERIYQAMLSRGFDGKIKTTKRYRIAMADALFFMTTASSCFLLRKYNLALLLGSLITGTDR